MSVQWAAEASQKFTWPAVTAAAPALTVAVNVTSLPAFTVAPGAMTAPPEVMVRVVVVATEAARAEDPAPQMAKTTAENTPAKRCLLTCYLFLAMPSYPLPSPLPLRCATPQWHFCGIAWGEDFKRRAVEEIQISSLRFRLYLFFPL